MMNFTSETEKLLFSIKLLLENMYLNINSGKGLVITSFSPENADEEGNVTIIHAKNSDKISDAKIYDVFGRSCNIQSLIAVVDVDTIKICIPEPNFKDYYMISFIYDIKPSEDPK